MPPKIARLAGLGAFGACAGLLLLYFGLVFLSVPRIRGGIDMTSAVVAWIALGGLFAGLIIAHIVVGKQLLRMASGGRHPL